MAKAAIRKTTALGDVVSWESTAMPIVSTWNVSGPGTTSSTPPQYFVDLLKAGYRVLPTFRLLLSAGGGADLVANADALEASIAAADWTWMAANRVPLCLRCNNVNSAMSDTRYRLPLLVANVPLSPLVWTSDTYADPEVGEPTNLDDQNLVDHHGPTSLWANEGELWGAGPVMQRLCTLMPTPAWVIHLDNHEGIDDRLTRYTDATANEDVFDTVKRAWKSVSTMHVFSASPALGSRRMRARLQQLLDIDINHVAENYWPEFWQKCRDQWLAMYNAFEAELVAAWQGKVRFVGYGIEDTGYRETPYAAGLGYYPKLSWFDNSSSICYTQGEGAGGEFRDFTSPDWIRKLDLIPVWEKHREMNPTCNRELSLWMPGPNVATSAAYWGKSQGFHEFMSPARWQAHIEWLLWSLRDPGVPLMLRWFEGSTVSQDDAMFDATDLSNMAALGITGFDSLTCGDYFMAIVNAVQLICTNKTLRSFWQTGTPILAASTNPGRAAPWSVGFPRPGDADNAWRVLECSENTAHSGWVYDPDTLWNVHVPVWAVATLNQAGNLVLLNAWSPKALTGTCTVTVPGCGVDTIDKPAPKGYWTIPFGSTTPTLLSI